MRLISPNGVAVEAAEHAAEGMLAAGFKLQHPEAADKKQPARKRPATKARPKE